MSNWIEDSAKVIIKEQFRYDFPCLLDGRFSDVENGELKSILVPRYNSCGDYEHIMHILKGTEYNDGILTFEVSFMIGTDGIMLNSSGVSFRESCLFW